MITGYLVFSGVVTFNKTVNSVVSSNLRINNDEYLGFFADDDNLNELEFELFEPLLTKLLPNSFGEYTMTFVVRGCYERFGDNRMGNYNSSSYVVLFSDVKEKTK